MRNTRNTFLYVLEFQCFQPLHFSVLKRNKVVTVLCKPYKIVEISTWKGVTHTSLVGYRVF